MRLKTRLSKRVKIHKSKDEKVPVAWEQGKDIPKLPYKQCNVIEDSELDQIFKKVKYHFKIPEQKDIDWFCEGIIDEIKFEHATIHNVDFEWGTFGRAFR